MGALQGLKQTNYETESIQDLESRSIGPSTTGTSPQAGSILDRAFATTEPRLQSKHTSFLDLPAEIRNRIYNFSLINGEPIRGNAGFLAPENDALQLLRTNRQIYREAREIYYAENTFYFHAFGGGFQPGLTGFLVSLSYMQPEPDVKAISIRAKKISTCHKPRGHNIAPCVKCDGLLDFRIDFESLTVVPVLGADCCGRQDSIAIAARNLQTLIAAQRVGIRASQEEHTTFVRNLFFKIMDRDTWRRDSQR